MSRKYSKTHNMDKSEDSVNILLPKSAASPIARFQTIYHTDNTPANSFFSCTNDQNVAKYSGELAAADNYNDKSIQSTISSISEIDSCSWDQSSTSSMSWFDDFDSEATKKLAKEYEDIERVLYGEASPTILRESLRIECEDWIRAFPHLRVTGKATDVKKFSSEKTGNHEEIIAIHPSGRKINHFHNTGKSLSPRKRNESLSCIFNSSEDHKKNHSSNNGNLKIGRYSPAEEITIGNSIGLREGDNIETYLRISPISCEANYRLSRNAEFKNNHLSSIMKSEMSASKWQRQSSPEFSSLPYIPIQNPNITIQNFFSKDLLNDRINSGRNSKHFFESEISDKNNSRQHLKSGKTKTGPVKKTFPVKIDDRFQTLPLQKNSFTLPPISGDKYNMTNGTYYYRSISATPRKQVSPFIKQFGPPGLDNRMTRLDRVSTARLKEASNQKVSTLKKRNTNTNFEL